MHMSSFVVAVMLTRGNFISSSLSGRDCLKTVAESPPSGSSPLRRDHPLGR